MAESPPRFDTPDSAPGDDLTPGGAAPWGDARPWWSADSGGGTGPHAALPDGTGPQIMIRNATGPLPVLPGPLPSPPPPGRRRAPVALIAVATATVAVAVLAAGVLAYRTENGGGGAGARAASVPESQKVISAGPAAGGLRKDLRTPPSASAAYPFVAGAIQAAGVPVAEHGQAVYTEEPVRPVNVLFMGGTGQVGNPADFLHRAQPTTFLAGQDAEPGGQGGKAVCGTFAVLAETHTYCAWATEDSYGVVASNRASLNPRFTLMADVMRRIRKDVERPR